MHARSAPRGGATVDTGSENAQDWIPVHETTRHFSCDHVPFTETQNGWASHASTNRTARRHTHRGQHPPPLSSQLLPTATAEMGKETRQVERKMEALFPARVRPHNARPGPVCQGLRLGKPQHTHFRRLESKSTDILTAALCLVCCCFCVYVHGVASLLRVPLWCSTEKKSNNDARKQESKKARKQEKTGKGKGKGKNGMMWLSERRCAQVQRSTLDDENGPRHESVQPQHSFF